jgi:hypothetical protein
MAVWTLWMTTLLRNKYSKVQILQRWEERRRRRRRRRIYSYSMIL